MNAFHRAVEAKFGADFLQTDPAVLSTYGSDWTREVEASPQGVVRPTSTEQVASFLKLCNEHGVSVVPSGGRTGLAGGAVAAQGEVVLNLERMNKMGDVDRAGQTVRVQVGAVTQAVREHCERSGLTWPVRFAAEGSSQIGGNLSTNVGGIQVIRFGMARQWVLALQVVLMDGRVLELGGALEKDNSGPDLKHLFIGSEGTLGIITEATLKLTALPRETQLFYFALEDFPKAVSLLEAIRTNVPLPLQSFEVMGSNCVELVAKERNIHPPCKGSGPYFALVEFEVGDRTDVSLDEWLEGLFNDGLVVDGAMAQSSKDAQSFWALREGIGEALANQGLFHKNDVSVPVAALTDFVEELPSLFASIQPDLELYVFGHLGDGNLHLNVVKPESMNKKDFLEKCRLADEKLFERIQHHKGSISAEHGIGLLKRPHLHYTRSPVWMDLVRAIKAVMDPKGLLNPGKILPPP